MALRSTAFAVTLSFAALPAVAADAGLEWKPIAAADSKIRITLAETKDLARYFRAQSSDFSADLFIVRVPAQAYRGDQVVVSYVELMPDRFFPDKYDVGRVLALKGLKDFGISESERFTVVAGGVYDVVTFTIHGDVACAAFARTWGSFAGDQVGAGSRRLSGYGCEDRGKPLGRDRIKEALASLEIDD